MVSPKPESYHGALYHLAAAAESSPSPQHQHGHYQDPQHYQAYHHQHHEPPPHHHTQNRHYPAMPPMHRAPHSQEQYRYSDNGYSPMSAAGSSTGSAPHHASASAPRQQPMPGPSTHADHPPSVRPPPKHIDAPLKNGSAASAAAAAAAAADAAAAAAAAEKKISCMECRLSKVKCSGGDLCTRCKRLGKECYYKSHKRGRKSDSSKIQKLERTVDSLSRALEQFSRNKGAGSPTSVHTLSKSVSVDSKRNARLHAQEDNDNSSPDSFWKSVEASRAPAPPSNSAMSPPSQSPRANGSATYRDQNNAARSRPSDLHRQRSTSSSWQTPKSIASATPTSDDPDEPENLGLPTLSNPLKLLAHASDSARDGEPGAEVSDPSSSGPDPRASEDNARSASGGPANHHSGSAFNADGTVSSPSGQDPSSSGPNGESKDHNGKATLFGVYQGLNKTNTVTRFGPGRGKAFFDVGLFSTKPDNLPNFDPIDRGYLSLAEAESLYSVYIQYINPTITLLDPHLHTFDYVRSCSSLLLSCTCWIAAKYKVEGSQIADDLEMHIRSNLLPTILMEGFRNAEIPQALIILAAYHPQMNTLSEDKAWTYLGFAIRIASELDMNSRIAVRPPNRQDDAGLARRLRNRERTWLNLWLYETSMSQQMGRRPTLANDPVVLGCAHWHLDPFALEQDKAVVAVVQLRLLMKRNTELFENFVDISTSPLSAERTAKHVELFRRICASDLDAWLATWTAPSNQPPKQPKESLPQDTETGGDPSSANRESDGNGELPPTHPRTNRLKLYYWYARLALDAIALKCSHLGLEVLRPVYRDAYACCMAYLGLFVATMVPNGLFWGHNSAVVTPAYCAIFALKIVGLISTTAGASGTSALAQRADKGKEEDLGIDIDAEYTFEMVEKLAKACEEAGNATPHRRAAAGSYAFFLFTVLAKAKSAWNAKLGRTDGNGEESRATKGRKRDREGNDGTGRQSKSARNGKAASRDRQQKERADQNGDTTMSDAAPGSANANGDQAGQGAPGADASVDGDHLADQPGGVGGTDSDHHFLRQLMQFQAGPSGVQTAIVHDASNQEPHNLYGFPQQHHYANFTSNPVSASHMAPMPFDANMSTMAASNAASAAFGAATGNAGMGPDGAAGVDGTSAAAQGVVDIDWDFGMLDGFLGESLFSDMSFISASATPANMNGVNGA